MSLVDRILLLMLVLILPLGIVFSKTILSKQGEKSQQEEVVEKVDTLISNIQNRENRAQTPQTPGINITGVIYASDSGRIRIAGVVPSDKHAVMVSATVLPVDAIPDELGGKQTESVLGQAVEVRSIKPQVGGSFVYDYPVQEDSGVIDFLIQQDASVTTVQFDLGSKKQIQ